MRFAGIPLNRSPHSQHWSIAGCKQAQQGDHPGRGDSAAEATPEGFASWGHPAQTPPAAGGQAFSPERSLGGAP